MAFEPRLPPDAATSPNARERDREDLLLLATTLIVPVTWLLGLGWSWSRSLTSFDGLSQSLLTIRELVAAHGHWGALAYRVDLLGGDGLRDSVGPLPLLSLLAWCGFAPVSVLNLTVLTCQMLLGYLGGRAASDLASCWTGRPVTLSWIQRIAGIWLIAFSPSLGWRIGYGHLAFLTGLLPFFAEVALLAAARAGRVGGVLLALAAFAQVNGLLFTGHQIVLNSVVFGGPVLLALWAMPSVGNAQTWRRLSAPLLVPAAAALIAFPDLWEVIRHYALSSDSARSIGQTHVVYSYGAAHLTDWLSNLAWTRMAIRPDVPEILHHELNQPLGPALALLALVPWRRGRTVIVGLLVSLLLVVAFSTNATPVSTALLALVPPLNAFRVPSRAGLPTIGVIPVVVLAALAARERRTPHAWRSVLLALGCGALLFVVPPMVREVLGWAIAAAVVATQLAGKRVLVGATLGLALAGGTLSAFRERLLPYPDGHELLARAEGFGEATRRLVPALSSRLSRVMLAFEIAEFHANTAFAARLSSLDGYYWASRRFLDLAFALAGTPYDPNSIVIRFRPGAPLSRAMFALYDVEWAVVPTEDGRLGLARLGRAAGPAWFPKAVVRVPSFAALARTLLDAEEPVELRIRDTLWVVSSSEQVQSAPATIEPACTQAHVRSAFAGTGPVVAAAAIDSPGLCPLTFAMNYGEALRATGVASDGSRIPLLVFPAYGSLTGVLVPGGVSLVEVSAAPPGIPMPAAWYAAGFVLLGLAWYFAKRMHPAPAGRDVVPDT